MKTKNNKGIFTAILLVTACLFGACDDFLDYAPNDRNTLDNFFQSPEDLLAATGPLYNQVWFDFNDKFFYGLGDGRSNNLFSPYSDKSNDYITAYVTFTETQLTGSLGSAWQSFYNVIAQSNNVITNIRDFAKNVSDEQKNAATGEARFMRGTAYWYLASLWGDVVVYEDQSKLIDNYLVSKTQSLDVMEFAIRDLEFAAKYLPETAASGRLTRYSAFGMLAKAYLSMAGLKGNGVNSGIRSQEYLDLAAKAAKIVCESAQYQLLDNYAELFKIQNNNNVESLFALQWIPNGDYGVTNTQQAYFAYSTLITGDDTDWGKWAVASMDMMNFYDNRDQTRRKATWMGKGDFYPEINTANGGLTVDNTAHNMANVKKGIVGSAKDNDNKVSRMNSALNTYMLRLADVYLLYAEAILGNNASTDNAEALKYFNKVRTRTKDLPAITDKITYKDIQYERRVELAMEGQYWYDLLRRAYYQQQEVLNYLNDQQREKEYAFDPIDFTITPSDNAASHDVAPATPERLLLPIPESEIAKNPLLSQAQPAIPYSFTESKITDLFE
ncbi:MAG: RagB/SusD family nutrient uptake outer membrane protein [Candidatus Symbiothrix sp.]|nr:RagB/SusD family nutrient uptake outer membrane protein [Candidatus Symbiothrix sp.]